MNPSDLTSTPAVAAKRTHHATITGRRAGRCWNFLFLIAAIAPLVLTGCQLGFGKAGDPDRSFWDTENIQSPFKSNPLSMLERESVKDKRKQQLLMSGKGQKELEQAIEQYEGGNKGAAVKRFQQIAKRYSETATGEEALYRHANAMYESNNFAKAQDSYALLLEDYPSSRYMNQSTGRLFKIARYWLDQTSTKSSSEILLASAEEDAESTRPKRRSNDPTLRVPVLPNFHDKTRPMFDTQGRALQALRDIWLNDPTGELADDALMMTASHYLNKGDYVEADRYFQILREECRKSPHLEDAYILGSHVKQMSYQGGMYDVTPLAEAEKLKKSTLRIFPDNENRERLRDELRQLKERQAGHDWEMVEIWMKKKKPVAIAVACQTVIESHPTTKYAERARQVLEKIDPKLIEHLPLNIPRRRPSPDEPYEE